MNASKSIATGRVAGLFATTALIAGIALSAAAFARDGGSDAVTKGRPQATPTYDSWVAGQTNAVAVPRVEAASGTILTDAAVDIETQATPERRVLRQSR